MTWHRSTLAWGLAGSLLYWAALPPLALAPLGWVAPVPWLLLVRGNELAGRRPYRALWLAGLAFWLMAIHWLRLPHPATSLGWLALSAYLACYLPVFIGLSRVAVHRLRVPLWLAAPVVWTGLELARAHLLTGFLMASLSHTQVHSTTMIQLADLVGQYGVDFLVMLVAACLAGTIRNPQLPRWRPVAVVPAALALLAAVGYGHWRLDELDTAASRAARPGPRIALVQGNSLAEWKADPNRERDIMDEYIRLSGRRGQAHFAPKTPQNEPVPSGWLAKAKARGGRPVDLVVWPETMFRTPLVSFDLGYELPPDVERSTDEIASLGPRDLARLVAQLGTPVLVGIDRVHFVAAPPNAAEPPPPRRYNSAVLVGRDGRIVGTYDKEHRVVFGEYIPFADWLPFLYGLTPLAGGIEPGAGPACLAAGDVGYAPNICYETVLPHVIRRQVSTLNARSTPPDVLVNLTNDAWYWGSSELDMHLACDVFRAVECRRPMVVAANGGISAWIDHCGRIRAQSPRQQTDVILADVELSLVDGMSLYVSLGDWFAGACLACCLFLTMVGMDSERGTGTFCSEDSAK